MLPAIQSMDCAACAKYAALQNGNDTKTRATRVFQSTNEVLLACAVGDSQRIVKHCIGYRESIHRPAYLPTDTWLAPTGGCTRQFREIPVLFWCRLLQGSQSSPAVTASSPTLLRWARQNNTSMAAAAGFPLPLVGSQCCQLQQQQQHQHQEAAVDAAAPVAAHLHEQGPGALRLARRTLPACGDDIACHWHAGAWQVQLYMHMTVLPSCMQDLVLGLTVFANAQHCIGGRHH